MSKKESYLVISRSEDGDTSAYQFNSSKELIEDLIGDTEDNPGALDAFLEEVHTEIPSDTDMAYWDKGLYIFNIKGGLVVPKIKKVATEIEFN